MSILGFQTPEFILLKKGDEVLAYTFNADQRQSFETFCNGLVQRVSVDVYTAMMKASEYVLYGIQGVKLNDSWGPPYHALIAAFTPVDVLRLTPATQEQRDYWDPFKGPPSTEKVYGKVE